MNDKLFQKGFGVLEVLVASTIIITILGGLVTIGTMAINTNEKIARKAEATFLAQEGIEMVRQIRDTNWVDESAKNTNWDSLVLDNAGKIVRPDYTTAYYLSQDCFDQKSGCILQTATKDDKNRDVYGNITYTRTVKFEEVKDLTQDADRNSDLSKTPANLLKVTLTVSWLTNQSVTVSELLTNWRPNF
ncbi:MAG: hypothetical protein AAB881_00135 [Patescibacteria group bacterium]